MGVTDGGATRKRTDSPEINIWQFNFNTGALVNSALDGSLYHISLRARTPTECRGDLANWPTSAQV